LDLRELPRHNACGGGERPAAGGCRNKIFALVEVSSKVAAKRARRHCRLERLQPGQSMSAPRATGRIMRLVNIACVNAVLVAALLLAAATPSFAEYPDRPIQIVVPYTPGGTVDLLARSLGSKLTAAWGQPVVILNRPGAGGSIGAEFVAKSAADGYTVLISTNSPLTTNLALYLSLGYEPLRDFEPVILAGENPLVLAANPKLPVKNVKDLIELAKKKPGQLDAGTSGNGSTAHLSLATFNKQAGVSIVHVPYRGGVPSLMAAIAGEVQLVFSDIVPAMPQIRDGRLTALGQTGLRRAQIAPDIPTLNESGLPGFNITAWIGVVAPKGTPKDVVQKLNLEIGRALKDPEFAHKISAIGIDPLGGTPDEFAVFLRQEIPRWKQIVQDAGVKVQDVQ
jgi:tripartite-type tricarboxylate transporter receptor subunit TctC